MSSDYERDRARRVKGYLDWLRDDVDGLTFNLMDGAGKPRPLPGAPAILFDARIRVADALSRIDQLVAATTDRSARNV